MTRCRTIPVLAALALLIPASLHADEPIKLRYQGGKDKPLIYRTVVTTKQTELVLAMKVVTTFKQTAIAVQTFEAVDSKGNLRYRTENKRMKFQMDIDVAGNKQGYVYDSTLDEQVSGTALSEPLNPVFDRLDGARLQITLSPRGKVVAVKGLTELLADVIKDNPLGEGLTAGGTDEGARVQESEFYIELPEKPIKVGDTWTVPIDRTIPNRARIIGKQVHKLAGFETVGGRRVARITYSSKGTIKVDIKSKVQKVSGELEFSAAEATVLFDPASGQIVSMKSRSSSSGTLNVEANGMQLTVESDSTSTVTFERLEKLPE